MNLPRLAWLLTAFALSSAAATAAEPAARTQPQSKSVRAHHGLFHPGALAILPDDGRQIYLDAFAAARKQIRIEICVLEDPAILAGLKQAIDRGVSVRVIVDGGKYAAPTGEKQNLDKYLSGPRAQLHISNPIFPRSFPKVILIDERTVLMGSACLDTTTFHQYRDYAYVTDTPGIYRDLSRLFENDWLHSAPPSQSSPKYNPTPVVSRPDVLVSPVNATPRIVAMIQNARKTLDVTSELLGNPTLESELTAAVAKGVRVRLIAPQTVNGGSQQMQAVQAASLTALKAAGVKIHVTRAPESAQTPYMHARMAVADGKTAYLGSISLSPDSSTYDRGVGLILGERKVVRKLQQQFETDFGSISHPY